MRVGVLLCDRVKEELQPKHGDYPNFFEPLILEAMPESEVTFFDVTCMQFPSQRSMCEVYVVSGSKKSCNDPDAWITQLHEFVYECFQHHTPLVGICFGHQVMARALGGEVERSHKGWGVGVHSYYLTKQRHLFDNQSEVRLICSHQDQVTKVGKGGEVIGGSEFCPNAIVTYKECHIGIQAHPELSKDYARDSLAKRKHLVGDATYFQALHGLEQQVDSVMVAQGLLKYHTHAKGK